MLTRAKKKRKTGGSTQTLFSVRWARQLEWDEDEGGGLYQLETCGGTIEEARNDVESALSEFDGVNNDAGGIDQAFHDKKDAIAAQKQRIQTLIEKAGEGVMNALEITQQRLSERFGDGTVVEQASVTGLGVNEVRGDICKGKGTMSAISKSEKITKPLNYQIHFGPNELDNPSDIISATECITTKISVWITSFTVDE